MLVAAVDLIEVRKVKRKINSINEVAEVLATQGAIVAVKRSQY